MASAAAKGADGPGFVAFLLPLVFVLGALAYSAWVWDDLRNSGRVEGTVIAVTPFADEDSTSYEPTFRYLDGEGRPREAVTWYRSSFYDYEIGSTVGLLVRPDRPDRARVDSFLDLWLMPAVFGGAGLFFIAVLLLIRGGSRTRGTEPARPARGAGPAVRRAPLPPSVLRRRGTGPTVRRG